MSVVETLRAGRAEIVARGWRQGGNFGLGSRCAADALLLGNAPMPEAIAGIEAMERALPCAPHHLVPWNDAPGRTKEHVLALYDKAIAAEEAKTA